MELLLNLINLKKLNGGYVNKITQQEISAANSFKALIGGYISHKKSTTLESLWHCTEDNILLWAKVK